MKKLTLLFLFCIVCKTTFAQQDANFTQYIFNTIYVNPAYAGYKGEAYIQSFYRNQWTGVKGAPKTLSAAADASLYDNKIGLSLQVVNDKLGVTNQNQANVGLAYHISNDFDKTSKFSFGMNFGIIESSINGNLLDPNQYYDEYIPTGKESTIIPDATAGILFTNEYFFAGFSANHILSGFFKNKNSNININIKPHYYVLGGLFLPLNEDFLFKPLFLLKEDFAGPTNLDINALLAIKEKIWIGAVYRTSIKIFEKSHLQKDLTNRSAAGGMIEIFAKRNLRIGYSYDYAVNRLNNINGGTHEVSIGFYIKPKMPFSYCKF